MTKGHDFQTQIPADGGQHTCRPLASRVSLLQLGCSLGFHTSSYLLICGTFQLLGRNTLHGGQWQANPPFGKKYAPLTSEICGSTCKGPWPLAHGIVKHVVIQTDLRVYSDVVMTPQNNRLHLVRLQRLKSDTGFFVRSL